MAEGATIITQKNNEEFFERALNTPRTLLPAEDTLAKNPKKAKVEAVSEKKVYSDGTRTVEMYHVASAPHSNGLLIAYIPKEKVLFQGDFSLPAPGQPGNDFKDVLAGEPDLLVRKSVNSAFYGTPDLHAWLGARAIRSIVICGITTNHCCETTARMAGNLGYDVLFVTDATHTFDRRAPDGTLVSAEELHRATDTSLHGEFATVVRTAELVQPLSAER